VAEHLDLSDAQREEIRGLVESAHENAGSLWADLQRSRERLMEASSAEPFDEAEVRAAAVVLANAEAELAIHRASVMAQVRAVLTPEQQQQAEALRQRMREDRGASRGHHGGHGYGGWGEDSDDNGS